MALDDVTNKANTLRLWLPKKSMAAGEAHVLQLEASLLGNPAVAAKVVLAFTVELDSLVPLISGGGVQVRAVASTTPACMNPRRALVAHNFGSLLHHTTSVPRAG